MSAHSQDWLDGWEAGRKAAQPKPIRIAYGFMLCDTCGCVAGPGDVRLVEGALRPRCPDHRR